MTMQVSPAGHTQYICHSKPFCRCVGKRNKWDECSCRFVGGPFRKTAKGPVCRGCGAKMVLIDFATGEAVQ